jgi:PIN domain nuclease of toxin-antitoxin system
MTFVLDACAIIALLKNESGAEIVDRLLLEQTCMAHSVNLCEVYYDFLKAENENVAQKAINDLEKYGLIFREDMDQEFWKEVGSYKAGIKRVSLADCFAIALANREQAVLVTSDHHEFDHISEQGICQVMFIR